MPDDRRTAILDAVRRIPAGRVSSYGGVARLAGFPGRARLVGQVLRTAPDDCDAPWYRVVRASGELAFPKDSEQFALQQEKLAAEGVQVVRGKVAPHYFGSDDDLDSLLWGPS